MLSLMKESILQTHTPHPSSPQQNRLIQDEQIKQNDLYNNHFVLKKVL
jgi:hypothetical protein